MQVTSTQSSYKAWYTTYKFKFEVDEYNLKGQTRIVRSEARVRTSESPIKRSNKDKLSVEKRKLNGKATLLIIDWNTSTAIWNHN